MKALLIMCGLMGLAHAAEIPVKPSTLKPVDPTERVQICGKNGCSGMPLSELLIRIERERSGGGDIIGNGGGLAEQNFTYALTQLADFISETVKEGLVKGPDAENLKRIGAAARTEALKADKLVFLSGKNNPGIFTSENDPEVRLAKTGLTQDAPIFVNMDLLYSKRDEEVEMLPVPVMVASLVHELGHQVGIKDHAYLDFLGARVRKMIEREYNRVARQLDEDTRIEMVSINLGAYSMPKLSLMVRDTLIPFEKELTDVLKCRDGKRPRAARLSNQHWERAVNFDSRWVTPYRAWATLTCQTNMGQVISEERDFILDLVIDVNEKTPSVQLVQIDVQN